MELQRGGVLREAVQFFGISQIFRCCQTLRFITVALTAYLPLSDNLISHIQIPNCQPYGW